ncbi:MAG: type II toxin-antitoxin system VapC family toxin [Candidatus Scalindua sp.]
MAKKAACIDTDLCIDFLRKREPGYNLFVKVINNFEPCCITTITAFELCLGHIKMGKKKKLDGFFEQFKILPFDFIASKMAADIQSKLDKKGAGIGMPDTLIAAICAAHKIPFITGNIKHFSRVESLELIELSR